jgi:undecaprenyl-diphosphatase
MAGAEPREHLEAPTCAPNTEVGELDAEPRGDAKDLLERICARENMREAYRRVVRNGGAGGVDGMQVTELDAWLHDNYDALIGRLLAGKYKPMPVRRVEIPKEEKGKTWTLWFKVCVAILPSGILGVLFDDWMDEHLHNAVVVSIALIVYGVAFILVERRNQGKYSRAIADVHDIGWKTALLIGCFQALSLIPGTSRSGSTILGAILLGVGRGAGAEFSFFMAIPTMLGASAIKLLKFFLETGLGMASSELTVLIVGMVVSFVVSLLVIKGLMEYVRKHSFSAFGVYRIILGIVVLAYFLLVK